MVSFVHFVLLFEVLAQAEIKLHPSPCDGDEWTKQLGTVAYPKLLSHSRSSRVGDIFEIDGMLYKIKQDGNVHDILQKQPLPETSNEAWRVLKKGSFTNPKIVGTDYDLELGDVFYDKSTNKYFEGFNHNGKVVLGEFNKNANWMELLREEIGDIPLGDVMTPGTHDTGTAGIDADSYLVDRNSLFLLALSVEPQILANWSLTQETSLGGQLDGGFRGFDMRIADMEQEDGSFRWWHGTTGYEIQVELQELVEFLDENPYEIVRMDFGHFARPGNILSPTLPIPNYRKDIISDILLDYSEPYLVPKSAVSDNPTMNEMLEAGGQVIITMRDSYIEAKHEGFWPDVLARGWSGRTNPEDLFSERSGRLEGYKQNSPDKMSVLSGCNTPDDSMIVPGLLRVFGHNDTLMDIIREIFPNIDDADPDRMSFEGLWTALVDFTRYGTNTDGMWARPGHLYTSGASVHYRGVNEMARHWLARPQLYKLNELHVDDAVESSTLVDTAIEYHTSGIPREVTVAYQGNAKDGYYVWDDQDIHAEGGTDGLECPDYAEARYRVTSSDYILAEDWITLPSKTTVSLQEGEYPPDAQFTLEVSLPGLEDFDTIYEGNVQDMIENNLDLYLRATDLGQGSGYAYTSYTYNVFGDECGVPPAQGYLTLIQW